MNDCATSTLDHALRAASASGGKAVLLVRHARTADNAAKVLVGRRDVPLDAVGRDQAARLRRVLAALSPSSLVTSPLLRARQTVDGLGPARVEPRLIEVDHGEIEGLQEVEFRARYGAFLARWLADPEGTRIPGGESLGQAASRGFEALEQHASEAPGPGPLVVCSHQLVIATLLCRCQDLPLGRYRELTCRNTAVNVLGFRRGGWSVHLTDQLGHLEG